MPIDYSEYPDNWHELSRYIRRERAGNRCEVCGVPNSALIVRSSEDKRRYMIYDAENDYWLVDGQPVRLSEIPSEFGTPAIKVVLTVAHLDHDITHNDHDNLKAMCQLCHLTYDAKHHAQNARRTRADKKEQARENAGQRRLL